MWFLHCFEFILIINTILGIFIIISVLIDNLRNPWKYYTSSVYCKNYEDWDNIIFIGTYLIEVETILWFHCHTIWFIILVLYERSLLDQIKCGIALQFSIHLEMLQIGTTKMFPQKTDWVYYYKFSIRSL